MLEYSYFSERVEKRIEVHLWKMWPEYKLCGQSKDTVCITTATPFSIDLLYMEW